MVYPGKYYGTLKEEMQRIWRHGKAPLVDIDVKGALAISDKYPDQKTTIFIEAPSITELSNRLRNSGTETEHSLHERITKAEYELTFAPKFDHILVNDDLDKATLELVSLVSNYLEL